MMKPHTRINLPMRWVAPIAVAHRTGMADAASIFINHLVVVVKDDSNCMAR
jgi:hypothetical protein